MGSSQSTLVHLPFFDAVAAADESAPEWRGLSAGLVTMRLFDAWISDGPGIVAPDAWGARAVREAIASVGARSPMTALLTGVVDAMARARDMRLATVAPRLMAYARALQFDGRWTLAADVYRTVLAHAQPLDDADVVITASMHLGACLRVLAEPDEAAAAYASAGRVAALTGDLMNVLRSRIAEAHVAMDRGNLPAAEAIFDESIAKASASGHGEMRALALHGRANVAHRRGNFELAVRLGYEALDGFREQVRRDRALADLASTFYELGLRSAARDAHLILAATAQEQYTRWVATINLMEIATMDRCEPVFEQYRRELADAELPASLAAYYQLYLGQGYRMFDKVALAREALERAVDIAVRHQLNEVLFKAEQALIEIREGEALAVAEGATPPESVVQVAGEIRRMKALAGIAD